MFLGKVIGNVWATRKHSCLENLKLLIVKPLDSNMKLCGAATMAVERNLSAGIGDTVLVLDEGGSARSILEDKKAPVRTVICGIVDKICKGG